MSVRILSAEEHLVLSGAARLIGGINFLSHFADSDHAEWVFNDQLRAEKFVDAANACLYHRGDITIVITEKSPSENPEELEIDAVYDVVFDDPESPDWRFIVTIRREIRQ